MDAGISAVSPAHLSSKAAEGPDCNASSLHKRAPGPFGDCTLVTASKCCVDTQGTAHPVDLKPKFVIGATIGPDTSSSALSLGTTKTHEPLGLEPPLKQPRLQFATTKPQSVEVISQKFNGDASSTGTPGYGPSVFVFGAQSNSDDSMFACPSSCNNMWKASKGASSLHAVRVKEPASLEPPLKRPRRETLNTSRCIPAASMSDRLPQILRKQHQGSLEPHAGFSSACSNEGAPHRRERLHATAN